MFFSNRTDCSLSVVFNIESKGISGSLVKYSKDALPTIVYSATDYFSSKNMLDIPNLTEDMAQVFDALLLDIIKNGFSDKAGGERLDGKIGSVVVTFSSPWFFQKTKNIEVLSDQEFIVTENFLKKVTNDEVLKFSSEIKKLNDDPETDYEVVEKSILNIKINGYVINKVIGKRANSMNAFLCMSIVSSNAISKIKEVVLKHTHLSKENIVFHTQPLVTFSVARDLFTDYDSFMTMSIGSDYTDMSLISSGVLTKTASFPSGTNSIVKQIAKELSVPNELAESSLNLYLLKKLDDESSKKVQTVLVSFEKEWSIYFEKAITDLSSEQTLPSRMYITARSDNASLFSEMIKLEKADSTASFRKNVNLVNIDSSVLNGLYKNQSHTTPTSDAIILAVFWSKFIC